MDSEEFWLKLGIRKPNMEATTYSLAIFAYEYVEHDSKEIKDYSPFINNYGYGSKERV